MSSIAVDNSSKAQLTSAEIASREEEVRERRQNEQARRQEELDRIEQEKRAELDQRLALERVVCVS